MESNFNRPGVDESRLQEFNQVLQKYKAGKRDIEDRAKAAEEWWKLHNHSEARKNTKGLGGFEAKSGWLHNVIVTKHADAMESYPVPALLPREKNDAAEAQMLSKIIPVVMEQNDFEETYSNAMWQKRKTGTGIYMITWDPDKLHGLGDISIKNVDVLNVYWEPGVKDIQDSKYFFHTAWMDNDELEAMYPQLKGRLMGTGFIPSEFLQEDHVDRTGKSVVIDVYYKRWEQGKKVLHFCKYVGSEILYSTENKTAETQADTKPISGFKKPVNPPIRPADKAPEFSTEQERADTMALGQKLGAEIQAGNIRRGEVPADIVAASLPGMTEPRQHYGLYDHGLYPFVFDPLFPVEKSPCGYGDIDLASNDQEQADILQTAFIKNVVAGAVPRYFVRMDGSVNEEEFSDMSRQFIHVPGGSLGSDSIRAVDYRPLPSNYVSIRNNVINELRETTGNTETATGSTTHGVTAASAIAALQEASGKGSKDNIRGSYRAYRRIVEMVIELIRQFYDIPRRFRITGAMGQQEFVSYSNANLVGQPMAGMMPGMEGIYSLPVFDIKVVPQKRSSYTTITQNELALEFYSRGFFDPQQTDKVLMCIEMMDFEGKDEMIQKITRQGTMWTRLSQWQELAISLAMKYGDPVAQGLMESITGERAVFGQRMDGGKVDLGGDVPEESGVTAKARRRAQMAAVPR